MGDGELFWLRQVHRNGDLATVTEPPGDMWRDLDSITRKGWIEQDIDHGRYRLSNKGRAALREREG